MKNRGKANKLVDHRLGESDPTVTLEEKLMDRFALETKVGYKNDLPLCQNKT